MMTSYFELKMLAKLIHEDTIAKTQQRSLARKMKELTHRESNEYHRLVIEEGEPCQC